LLPLRLALEKLALDPAEAADIPDQDDVEDWVTAAMDRPPSSSALGRMGLLLHWKHLSRDKRVLLLLLARETAKTEHSGGR
jgi:hypothetical protein